MLSKGIDQFICLCHYVGFHGNVCSNREFCWTGQIEIFKWKYGWHSEDLNKTVELDSHLIFVICFKICRRSKEQSFLESLIKYYEGGEALSEWIRNGWGETE